MGDDYRDLVGWLSEHRCPNCGRTLYVNKIGSAWCPGANCGYDDTFDAEKLLHLPPPDKIRQRDEELRALLGWDEADDQ